MIKQEDAGRRAMQMVSALKDLDNPEDAMAVMMAGLALMITLTAEDRKDAGETAKELGLNLIRLVMKDFDGVHERIGRIEKLIRATEGTRQ
jgi:hypothetical protein